VPHSLLQHADLLGPRHEGRSRSATRAPVCQLNPRPRQLSTRLTHPTIANGGSCRPPVRRGTTTGPVSVPIGHRRSSDMPGQASRGPDPFAGLTESVPPPLRPWVVERLGPDVDPRV